MFYVTNERKWVQITLSEKDYIEGLSIAEDNVLKMIETLDKGKGCFATNTYLASIFKVHPITVSRLIKSLKDKGYINIFYERKNQTKVKRTIRVVSPTQYSEKSQVIGVINYINGMYKEEADYEPIKSTIEIKKAIQQKIKEYHSQKELIQYLKMNRDKFLSTHGVSLWLQGQLTKEQLNI